MHLYGAFESPEFSEEVDPVLFQAAKVALNTNGVTLNMASKAGHVFYRGNHDKAGNVLYPILADWYFKNAPT